MGYSPWEIWEILGDDIFLIAQKTAMHFVSGNELCEEEDKCGNGWKSLELFCLQEIFQNEQCKIAISK